MLAKIVNALPRKFLIRSSLILGSILPHLYRGSKYHCPVCGGNFRRFLPYGRKWKKNRMCPGCFSLERHRIIWHFLRDELNFDRIRRSVLHIAPEQCFYRLFRNLSNLDYITADLESPLADVLFDITEIPYPDENFDFIMCNHVLEHVEADEKAISEMYRVLKPGGEAVIQVPVDYSSHETYEDESITDPVLRQKHFWGKDHVRLYGRDYSSRLENQGWRVEEKTIELDPVQASREVLITDYRIYYLRK